MDDTSICPECCLKSNLSVEERIEIAFATLFDRSYICINCGRHYARMGGGVTIYLNPVLGD